MKKRILVCRLLIGLGVLAASLGVGISSSEAREVPGLQQIQRGVWQESTPFKSYSVYRSLCIDKLVFLSMEGYAWGESSSTSSQLIQVIDATGKPKVCQ
jgi:hypothetical protein